MKKVNFYVNYLVLFFFSLSLICPVGLVAQTNPYDYYQDPNLIDPLTQTKISTQSTSADLNQQIAPPPVIITSSNGDVYLLQGDGVKAKMSVDQQGTSWTSYYLEGSERTMVNEFGETLQFQYDQNGQVVNVVNSNGVVQDTSLYNLGNLVTTTGQGTVTYQYDDQNRLASSTDQWGNVTHYTNGKASYVTDSTGNEIGRYAYNNDGTMQSYTDNYGNVTEFQMEKPNLTRNAQGTVTKVYQYDVDGHLMAVNNITDGTTTNVQEGYYTTITRTDTETGEPVVTGVYNFDTDNRVSSLVEIAANGVVTGWTEFDKSGRVVAAYNAEGMKVQVYNYNTNGFLENTVSLGAIDLTTGNQAQLSVTYFDRQGRPNEVWQIGDGGNMVKIQEYEYKANGLLDRTFSLGIERDDAGNAIVDSATNQLVYVRTSVTTYDKLGRPDAVYNLVRDNEGNAVTDTSTGEQVKELSQKYLYTSKGFMSSTMSYGANAKLTGRTEFNQFSRPELSYNAQGSVTQTYQYGNDGFLKATTSLGEGGVTTGTTVYNAKGRPTDVFNHAGSLVQSYDYDQYGLLVRSYSIGRASDIGGGNTMVVATQADRDAVASEWDPAWGTRYANDLAALVDPQTGNLSSADLISAAWAALNGGDTDKAQFFAMTTIRLFSGDASAQQENPSANVAENWALNDVAVGYFIMGATNSGATQTSAYKVVASDYSNAQAQSRTGTWESVAAWATDNLAGAGVQSGVVTGFTQFGGDSRPMASYSIYNGETVKVQDYDYSYEATVKTADGGTATVTKYSSFVRSTINYGGFVNGQQVVTGRTTFDDLGRQKQSFNEEGNLVQSYNYSRGGFLASTNSYGKNKTLTGTTVFNAYSQPVASFNYTNRGNLPANFLTSTQGLTEADLQNTAIQPFLGGLTQTFEYGADGFLNVSKNWGEASVTMVDPNNSGRATLALYTPTYTGYTTYDASGKTNQSFNQEGTLVQSYAYDRYGFMDRSISHGILTNQQGVPVAADGFTPLADGAAPISIVTGETVFDAYQRPTETYQVYNDGTHGEQRAMVQNYVYEGGFLTRTNNFGNNQSASGYTTFDNYGRQQTSYNEAGAKVSGYTYSRQGFLAESSNYGLGGTFLGKTVFTKDGRPDAAYNMTGAKTSTFTYNNYGFLASSDSYGQDQTFTGRTLFDGYGKSTTVLNDKGLAVSAYEYTPTGFLTKTTSLAFQADLSSAQTATNFDGQTRQGYYVVTGYTLFDDNSRPTESYQTYWDTQAGPGALVQRYNYTDGFVTSTQNFGQGGVLVGTTTFDKYGRQKESLNEFGEMTTRYGYSNQGFLTSTQNYGAQGTLTGVTKFNAIGRPTEATNHRGVMVQSFTYDDFSGQLNASTSYGEPIVEGSGTTKTVTPVVTGTTSYDVFGKALSQTNVEGVKVSDYVYDQNGFMLRTNSYGDIITESNGNTYQPLTGYTTYDAASRPLAAYSVSERGVETKVQEFIYNTNVTHSMADTALLGNNNTGFLMETISYGDKNAQGVNVVTGFTSFNKYGQQDASYNELNEMTGKFIYSNNGFMKESNNYGVNGTFLGKTVYDNQSRPNAAYNERGVLTQTFQYNQNGFLSSSTSYGDFNASKQQEATGITRYNAYGRQTETRNMEGAVVSSYEYNDAGFMVQSNNLSFVEGIGIAGQQDTVQGAVGSYVVTGYTKYNEYSRPTESYTRYDADDNVYNADVINHDTLTQVFNYTRVDADGNTVATGFVTGTTSYTLAQGTTGHQEIDAAGQTVTVANQIGSEVVYSGRTDYNKYGRPDISYNQLGAKVSQNVYSSTGFIQSTINFGEGGTYTGKLIFDAQGRPDYAVNHRNVMTTDYAYNSFGSLAHTLNYSTGVTKDAAGQNVMTQVVTSRTDFDAYSKATNTYQLYTGVGLTPQDVWGDQSIPNTYPNQTMYIYNSDDPGSNTAQNFSNGGLTGGALVQRNNYNDFGFIDTTVTFSAPDGGAQEVTQTTRYDTYSRPTEVVNAEGQRVSSYQYSPTGFLASTISFNDGAETSITYFNKLGQQTETYMRVASGSTYVDGAKSGGFTYNMYGFLERANSYQGNTLTGWTTFGADGKQMFQYNAQGSKTGMFLYDVNGFLKLTTQTVPDKWK
ncbi:MAG: hypothetical protein NC924_00640 [Candidatus Omnitrophica bacterium]|nr:hypothetical protein [Candidatus Omnitrophota bacterium]